MRERECVCVHVSKEETFFQVEAIENLQQIKVSLLHCKFSA